MGCYKINWWDVARGEDCLILIAIFIIQQIALNRFLIVGEDSVLSSYLWFFIVIDIVVLLGLSISLYFGNISNNKKPHEIPEAVVNAGRKRRSASEGNSRYCFLTKIKTLLSCFAWLLYSFLLVTKMIILFKLEIPQRLYPENLFGPHLLKFVIGLSAIMFTLFLQAHKGKPNKDTVKNSYLNAICASIALDILDSASFVSLLIGSESHIIYTFQFENCILFLSAINIILPSLTLYKLTAGKFEPNDASHLELLYKIIHLILINGSYLGVRIYLWSMFKIDTSIFIIKNIYTITNLLREIPSDISALKSLCRTRKIQQYQLEQQQNNKNGIGHDVGNLIETQVDGCEMDKIGSMRMLVKYRDVSISPSEFNPKATLGRRESFRNSTPPH